MKKLLIIALALLTVNTFAQRKKVSKKATKSQTVALAKMDNLAIEFQKNDFVLTIDNKTKTKDTILLAKNLAKNAPTDCKIETFMAKGTKLYLASWVENSTIVSKLSNEKIVTTNSVIVNLANKSKVLSNKHFVSEIALIQYLDVKQTVSETIRKKHIEGMSLSVLPDGDISKKSKTKEIRLSYSAAENSFEEAKKKK